MTYGGGVITLERGLYRVRISVDGKYKTIATGIATEKEARALLNTFTARAGKAGGA